MKQLTGNEIRQLFLDYFKEKGHMIEPGASLVPHNDPTLLWINAGVAALKKYFDGSMKPKTPRIANAQKSIRTNDIENVGKTARHHTFFEMLGNFSIGDYFKSEAIHFAWEFLTDPKYIGFEKEKLYITVYSDDDETYRIWTQEIGVDPSHICRTAGNYWEIGEGPCGPDTEIFYDRGIDYDPEGKGEQLFFDEVENDRYIEVWNVVFSQYDAKEGVERKDYKELPQRNIDTGMGLERLTCILQNGETNFDTDLFLPIIKETQKYAKHIYEKEYKMAYRVIADHIRTVTFALADGALFSNEGRGYVLRRVLRRAVRFGKKLEIEGAFMYRLVPIVYDIMKDFYPYLEEKLSYIQKLVKIEEERFHTTLSDGEKLMLEVMQHANQKVIDGKTAFKLYDTYGFPFELTLEMAQEAGYTVDQDGFKQEMQKQKERARNAREEVSSMASQAEDLMNFTQESTFIGYDKQSCKASVIGLFQNGKKVNCLQEEGDVIFDQTVCYAESGGQIGDSAQIIGTNVEAKVTNVIKAPHKQHLHNVQLQKGELKIGDEVEIIIDSQKRNAITSHHSCTHLLQSALKEVVGEHITQAGSYVCDEYLRFDFTHFEKVSEEQLQKIESFINTHIQAQYDVKKEYLNIEEAKASGATALFDEKYEDIVRVVSMGDVSKEFCGGCHVNNTKEIGICKIVSEESVGSGVRRIIAKTGKSAYEEFLAEEQILKRIAQELKLKGISAVEAKVKQVIDENTSLKKELGLLQGQLMVIKSKELKNNMQEVDGILILIERLDGINANGLKDIIANMKSQVEDCVCFFASVVEDKVVFVAGAGKKAIEAGIKCGDLVKEAALICDGKGGGRPDLAQAGGKNIAKVEDALAIIKNKLGISL